MRRLLATVTILALGAAGCAGSPDKDEVDPEPWKEGWRLGYVSEGEASVSMLAPTAKDQGWAMTTETLADATEKKHLLRQEGKGWQRAGQDPLEAKKGWWQSNRHLVASGPKNVWLMTGEENRDTGERRARAARFDGEKWQRERIPFSATEVVALPSGDLWAIDMVTPGKGGETAWSWDGDRWSKGQVPVRGVHDLVADGEDGVWALGHVPGEFGEPAIARHDGKRWQETPLPAYGEPAEEEERRFDRGLVRVGEDEVWAFGSHTRTSDDGTRTRPIAIRWDGKRWHKESTDLSTEKDEGRRVGTKAAIPDGEDGFVIGAKHQVADGAVHGIKDLSPTVKSGEGKPYRIGDVNLLQTHRVPGTQEIWAAGFAESSSGDKERRGVVVTYGGEG